MREWATDRLVSGMKVRMSSSELASHLRARAAYHRKRRDEKMTLLPTLKDAAEKIKAQATASAGVVSQLGKGTTYRFDGEEAVGQMEQDIKTHADKSVAFDWLSEHLFEEDYCLDGSSLVHLEILKFAI